MLVLALVLGVLLASASTTCLDNPSATVLYDYEFTTALHCGYSTSVSSPAYYTSYTIGTTGYYRIATDSNLAIEVREASCNGIYLACTSSTGATVIKSVRLVGGKKYVILVGANSSPLPFSANLEVTRCVSDCTAENAEDDYGPDDPYNYDNLAYGFNYELMIILPIALFGAALLLSIVFCVRGCRTFPGEQPTMVSVRKLAISVSLLSVVVMCTDWILFFSAFVYPFTLATLVIGVLAYLAAGPRFAESSIARNRSLVGGILLASAIIVFCGLGVGIFQLAVGFPVYFLLALFLPLFGVYVVGALLSMLILGIVLFSFRSELGRAGLVSGGVVLDNYNGGGVTIGSYYNNGGAVMSAPQSIPVATVYHVDQKGELVVVATPNDTESNYRG
ncbi:hypothetical protein BASA81_015297 [Batrachochytrium salamandrivorans]|nr:hypothetical protein BASA81_015297 [Batrachochytrium salamandrivorans]